MKHIASLAPALVLALVFSSASWAKIPTPVLNDEAKAKAAEAAAKTAHAGKVAEFQLCRSMDRVAARFQAEAKAAGKEVKPAVATPACVDPGAFVAAAPAAPAAAPAAPAPVAAAPAAPKKP